MWDMHNTSSNTHMPKEYGYDTIARFNVQSSKISSNSMLWCDVTQSSYTAWLSYLGQSIFLVGRRYG